MANKITNFLKDNKKALAIVGGVAVVATVVVAVVKKCCNKKNNCEEVTEVAEITENVSTESNA